MSEADLYKTLYSFLFNQITDTIYDLDRGCVARAKERLCQAQLQAEAQFMEYDCSTEP